MTQLSADDQKALDHVVKRVCHFEETLGCFYRDGLWDRMDRLYHSYTQLRAALRDTSGRDRDDVYADARKEFGHELFIPYSFSIVETVLPALISNRPRILILPRNEQSDKNVEHMRALVDSQQAQIGMELRLQTVAKSALMYGLGVGKSYWLRREGQRTKLVELASFHPARAFGRTHTVETYAEPLFDDPTFEHVPVRDFFWDPFAATIQDARWAAHRTWRDTAYVNSRLQDPAGWSQMQLTAEDIEGTNGSADRYRKSVRGQFEAQAIPVPNPQGQRDADIHEVIEYHDKDQIITILDRQWIVLTQRNETNYGRLPFACYRPTEVPNQFVGKGEIEPVEDPQMEMNDIRTDRRWSSLSRLNPPLFAQEGMVEADKIKVGPGEINMVNGDPKDLIWAMDLKDVPASSYRETAEIAQDIVRTSGISDTFSGGEGDSSATATGVQLQLARASARIQNKTRRAEIELMRPVGEHWVRLNQRHVLGQHDVRTPAPPVPGEPERRWSWFALGPNELAGEFDIEIDGGSTTPVNEPQKRQDAQIKAQIAASPIGQLLEPNLFLLSILEDLGIKNPEAMIRQGIVIPPQTLDIAVQMLAQAGMDPQMAIQIMQMAMHEAQNQQEQQATQADHGQGQPGQQGPPQGDQAPPQQDAA